MKNHPTKMIVLIGTLCSLAFGLHDARAAVLRVPDQHPTIQQAIEAAGTGDVVVVGPGTYRERLRLKPGLTLRSAGDETPGQLGLKRAEETILDGGGTQPEDGEAAPGVIMAEGATLDGFTITKVGRYDDELWDKHHATRGDEQQHEQIGGFGAPGIGADGVNCTILNNIVHHNGHTGIAIRGAEGRVVTPVVKRNVSYRNMGGGIGIMRGASGMVSDNHCFENFYAGIGHAGASPLVERNNCHGNIRAGIGISEGACPLVRGNKCYQNRRAGIGIRTGTETSPVVEDNDCYENGMAGIGCEDEATPLIRMNRCLHNEMAGIGARRNAKPRLLNNECRENKLAGIGFDTCEEGEALVLGNRVIDNGLVAIGIHAGWKVEVAGNQLSREGGLPPMIMVFEGADCVIRDNLITGNGVAGVRVAGTARVTGNLFDGQTVRQGGPPHFGVWALAGSKVVVSGNRFKSWRHALHASEATVTVFDNTAESFSGTAFVVRNPARPARVFDNTALSADGKSTAVQVDGDQGAVRNNRTTKREE